MWRLASTRATPMWMQPEGPAAVTTSDALPKRYFVPKAPSPRGPPNSECTPRRHGGAGPPHSPEPTASRRTALGRGGGTARAGPSTRASAHTTCTTPSPVLGGRGHGVMAQMCRIGVLSMGSGGGGCSRRTGPPRARSVSGPRSRASRRSPGRPPSPPPPPSRPWRRRPSWSRICATGLGARVLENAGQLLALRGAHHIGVCGGRPLRDHRPRTPAALWRCRAAWSGCLFQPPSADLRTQLRGR